MGHVAHRWPTEKATSGPSECQERLGKTVFPTQYRKNRPRNDKGHKGGRHARLRGRGRHSRQPWTLRPLTRPPGPPLPSVGAPYCGHGWPTWLPPVVPPMSLPSLRSGAHSADACGVLPRGLRPRLPHVRIERKSGARLPPDHLLGGHGKPARPPHGLTPTRRGRRSGTPEGGSPGEAFRRCAWHAPPHGLAPVRRERRSRYTGGNRTWMRRAGCPPQRVREKNED